MRKAILIAVAFTTVIVAATLVWFFNTPTTFQLIGEVVSRVETTDSVVALTFDDGPTRGFTEAIVEILEAKGIVATFFLVGSAIDRAPEQARWLVGTGHEIGNHSYSHDRMVLRTLPFVRAEIERTDALIRGTGYRGPIHFRAPYGKHLLVLPWYLDRTDRTHVLWDVAPESFRGVARDSAAIVQHALERVRPGSIILLHVFYESQRESLKAVPGLIDSLRARGYRFVTVSDLMSQAAAGVGS
jgi:peptidoglycan/xylan/chitin deacetylase (PgdA/CDA1 family)